MLVSGFIYVEMGVDCCLLCYSGIVTIIAILYIFIDVNYFLRIAFTIGWGKLFDKKKKIDETTTIHGVCTSQDLDIFFNQMNNARYVRELDFARFHFYERTGLYDEIRKQKAHVLQTATNIRYRRIISMFDVYKITTKIIYWDEKTLYMEQQFVTVKDGFVRAVILSKQGTIGLNVMEVMAKLTGKSADYKPEPSEELTDWLSSMEKSSLRLRKKE